MNQHRNTQFLGISQQGDQTGQIMTVHRSKVGKPHVFKDRCRQQKVLQPVLDPLGKAINCLTARDLIKDGAVFLLRSQILLLCTQ